MSPEFLAHANRRRFDVVICDIDGCLLDELDPHVDLVALAKVAEHNHRAVTHYDCPLVTICSGRPQPFVECLSRLIGNLSVPCISENGVWIHNPWDNKIECDPTITTTDLESTAKLEVLLMPLLSEGAIIQAGKSASVSVIHDDGDWIDEKIVVIRELCAQHNLPFQMSRTWSCINCNLSKVSKATAVARLRQRLQLPKERMAGIGDTMGDLGIAEHVGTFCCPSNADERLKSYATFVSEKPICAGVVDILNYLKG